MCLGVAPSAQKNAKAKRYHLVTLFPGVAGVTEPGLYELVFGYKKPFLGMLAVVVVPVDFMSGYRLTAYSLYSCKTYVSLVIWW